MSTPVALRHRVFLDHDPGFHPFQGSRLFSRIGGQPTLDRFVDTLYDRFEEDAVLRPLFGRDLSHERQNQKRFFSEWLGGDSRNSDSSHTVLQHQHDGLPITRALAGRWLGHFRRALEACVAGEPERAAIFEQAQALAFALVNQDAEAAAADQARVAWCGVDARVLTRAAEFAQRGNLAGLRSALADAPDLARRPTYAAKLMQTAVLAGRLESVELLLSLGVDVDKPHYLAVDIAGHAFERVIFATPLCAARMKRRAAVEAALLAHGAQNDVFSAALLGNASDLTSLLGTGPEFAQLSDPATDALDITPIHHAVAGGSVEALSVLLAHTQQPLKAGGRALRGAAERANLALVELLLERGADATQMSAGRWVMHPEIAPLLAARGAAIDRSGSWIGVSCTGNQHRKDDPEYVRALLRYGARADDRRADGLPENAKGKSVGNPNATALHYATKSGFLQTIAVLLEHGADPNALDAQGRTPLDWLEQAPKSVNLAAVRRLLAVRG
jgi:truncated hemoglobin YjbI/ankyrin repeat protein